MRLTSTLRAAVFATASVLSAALLGACTIGDVAGHDSAGESSAREPSAPQPTLPKDSSGPDITEVLPVIETTSPQQAVDAIAAENPGTGIAVAGGSDVFAAGITAPVTA